MEVECQYSSSMLYACEVPKANITQPKTEIKTFKGKHLAGKNDSSVTQVAFVDTVVNFIPKVLINAFPNVTNLFIGRCGLKSISRADLSEFDNLEVFRAPNNKLKLLPSNLFIEKSKLKVISFFSNHLKFVSSRLLKPLLKNPLDSVDFRGNPSINTEYYAGRSRSGCKSIKALMDKIEFSQARFGIAELRVRSDVR